MDRPGALDPAHVREFELFFVSTKGKTLAAVLPLVRDLGEAEDVLQVAYERAAAHWSRVRHYEDPTGWVRRVAYNEAISWLRRAKRQLVDYLPDVAAVGGHHVDAYEHDAPPLLLALRKVEHRDRVVLTLRYVWEYSVEEIASELSISANTAKARLARARRRLGAAASVTLAEEDEPGDRRPRSVPQPPGRPAAPVQEGTSR